MTDISQRGKAMGLSPIRGLVPHARAAIANGVKVYHLNIGQPDIQTPTAAMDALQTYNHTVIEYGASEGALALRQIAREYYNQHVAPIELEDIYVTTGASEAIAFTLYASMDPGSEMIIPEPFYANYIGFAHVSNVNLVAVSSSIDNGFDLPRIEDIAAKITAKTKAIFLCNPSNPTGSLYTKEDLLRIGQLVKEHNLYLVVDEVYREFCYDDQFYSALSIPGLEDHVVVIDSISKVFSACGARIGYVVSRNQELMKSILKIAQLRLCPPMVGQHIAGACYEDRQNYLSEVKSEYQKRRDYTYQRLSDMTDVKCYLPKAAFYIMAELPVEDTMDFCTWLLTDFRKNKSTVMLAPGQGFYMTPDIGKKQVRIAYVLGIPELEKALDILKEGLEEYRARFY